MLRQAQMKAFQPAARLAAQRSRCLSTRRDNKPQKANDKHNAGTSFQGQMLESISSRITKERSERARAADERGTSAASRNMAYTSVLLFTGAIFYYIGTKAVREPNPDSTLPLSKTNPPEHKINTDNLQAAWADFVDVVGQENVSTTADDLDRHATSEWSSHRGSDEHKLFCVVYPGSTDEVSRVMRICHLRRIPVTAYSGGTSLEGHYVPTQGGISVDFRRMDSVVALHKDDLDVVVQPAVRWEQLNEQLALDGLFFPPDPGPGAMIGGMVGTGCSGTNAHRYGTMREWVLGLTVVLADGTVVRTRQRPRKSSAGYDLTRLFVGSEGTLGLVTEATLRLTTLPEAESVAVATFPELRAAADCVARVVRGGVPVAAVELLDDQQMRCINQAGSTRRQWREAPTLFFKFGGTAMAVQEQVDTVRRLARQAGGLTFDMARSPEERADLWSARKEALWSTMAVGKPGDRVWTGDVAVPISRLPDIVQETQKDVRESGLVSTIVGHAGDGNFHVILLYNDSERKLAEDCVHRMVKRAIEMEGTVTGEHGVGLVKRDYLPHELGESTVDAMRTIKAALDPLCLLNCDKVVRMKKPKPGEVAAW